MYFVKQFNSFDSSLKPHFGRFHLWSHSFGHYPTFMTIDENGYKNDFENWALCLLQQFSFNDNRIVQSLHYSTILVHSGIQFVVLSSVTGEYNSNKLNCSNVAPYTCNTHWLRFLERWITSISALLIFIPAISHASAKKHKIKSKNHIYILSIITKIMHTAMAHKKVLICQYFMKSQLLQNLVAIKH